MKDLSKASGQSQIETCHLGSPIKNYEIDSRDESSYIHEHLTTLNFIVREFELKNILEIGTGLGESLLAMAEDTGAHVTTVDIEDCGQARDKIMFEGDWENDYPPMNITFIKGKSDKLDFTGWFDLVLIDGGHSYKQVKKDIEAVRSRIKHKGFLVFHDTCNPAHTGVWKAIEEYLEEDDTWRRYHWFNCNGLLVLRKYLDD